MPLDWLCKCAECKQTSGLSFVIGKKNSEQGNNGTVSAKGVQ